MHVYDQIYMSCIQDIERIQDEFDGEMGICRNWAIARERMAELKSTWKKLMKEHRETEVGSTIQKALVQIRVKSNSRPDGRWRSDLYSAKVEFNWILHHSGRSFAA